MPAHKVAIVSGGTYGIGRGVRVNAVVPSGVLSGFTEGKPHLEAIAQRSVGGRVALPEDVANAVAYLLSDEAALVSGAVLNVNSFAGQGGLGSS